jgi:hypothetical protein
VADLQELADRLAIRELCDRYTICVTRRDWEGMAQCFHENGRWRAPAVGYDYQGRATVKEAISGIVGAMDYLIQMTHACVIDELTPTRAKVMSVLNEFGKVSAEAGVFVLGIYYDTLVKEDGRWQFEDRNFQLHYMDAAPPPGFKSVDYANQP